MAKKVLSREQIRMRIGSGDVIVIYNDQVLCLNKWLENHPGGDKAILHMVGRDATDEINGYHSKETIKRMRGFCVGRINSQTSEGGWINMIPPIQGGVYTAAENEEFSDSSSDDYMPVKSTQTVTQKRAQPRKVTIEEIADVSQLSEHQISEIKKDLERYPSLDAATQSSIQLKYRALGDKLEREGYYNCHYSAYFYETLRYCTFAMISYLLYQNDWYKLSAVFLGIFWHQVTFTVHDASHLSITHSELYDNLISTTIAGFLGGLSPGWWKRNHNVHHLVTNSPEHDPDIQHMPIFAVSTKLLEGLRSTYYEKVLEFNAMAKRLVSVQKWIFYPVMLFGRFNLYRLSYDHLFFNRGPKNKQNQWLRLYEVLGTCVFWYWYGYLVVGSIPTVSQRVWFVLISHWVTAPLHVQITLSHFAMSTTCLGPQESFAQQQLRTTMDVACPAWMDFVHGGLQFQAIHHLFPRMPRHRLREIQPLVREFAKSAGVEYKVYGFFEGNGVVLSTLDEVSRQAKVMIDCCEGMRKHGDFGMDLAS